MARIRHLRVGRYWASEDGIAAIPAGISIDLQIVDRVGGNRETFAPMGKWLRERLAYVTGPQMAGLLVPVGAEDLDEVLALSDRVAVMFEGQIGAVMDVAEATVERVGLLMAGSEIVAEVS